MRALHWPAIPRIAICRLALAFLLIQPPLSHAFGPDADKGASEETGLRGIDLQGKLHRLGESNGCQAVVVVFLATECPISNRYIPVLNELVSKDHVKPAVCIYGVISSPHVTRQEAEVHSEKFQPKFPILFDAAGELKSRLSPTHTPHAFLLSPQGKTLYDGAIDDRFAAINKKRSAAGATYLKDAVQAVLKHQAVPIAKSIPVGCPLEEAQPATRDGAVTFNREIAPILHAHCSTCHRPGESGPFPLLTFADAVKHARQIQITTSERIMPPWKPAPGFGKFREEAVLSEREIALIAEWVKGGMPEGSAADRPALPTFPAGWQLGQPDLILEMPQAFSLEAAGDDVHQHFVLPTGFTRDRLVEAVEFRPGNATVVHHASFYLDVTGAAKKLEDAAPDVGYGGGSGPQFLSYGKLRSWVPGMRPHRLPRGYGQLLRKGTDVMMEIHYQKSGKPETDRSKVGIYFAPPSARQMVLEIQVMETTLAVPAGEARFHQHVTYTLPTATTIFDVAPHLHLLGREARAEAHLPDGRTKPLIWIKDWDFDWQGHYVFLEPVRLPAGTKIECDFYFDNTAANPRNPHHPPQHVYWGEQSREEMAMCVFFYTCDTARDLQRSHARQIQARINDQKPAAISPKSALPP